MIEVRIRTVDTQDRAVRLGEVPFTEAGLDLAVELASRWGVRDPEGNVWGRGEISGQIGVDQNVAYFELLVESE